MEQKTKISCKRAGDRGVLQQDDVFERAGEQLISLTRSDTSGLFIVVELTAAQSTFSNCVQVRLLVCPLLSFWCSLKPGAG